MVPVGVGTVVVVVDVVVVDVSVVVGVSDVEVVSVDVVVVVPSWASAAGDATTVTRTPANATPMTWASVFFTATPHDKNHNVARIGD